MNKRFTPQALIDIVQFAEMANRTRGAQGRRKPLVSGQLRGFRGDRRLERDKETRRRMFFFTPVIVIRTAGD